MRQGGSETKVARALARGGGGVGGVQIGVTSDHHGNVAITQHFQGHGKVAFNETVHLIEALPLLFLTYSGSGEFYLYGVCARAAASMVMTRCLRYWDDDESRNVGGRSPFYTVQTLCGVTLY